MSLSLRKVVVSAFAAAVSLGTFAGVVNHIPNGSFENETVVADNGAKYGQIGEKNHTAGWTAGGNAWLAINNTPYCINGMGVIGTYCLALQDGAAASNSFTLAESGFYRLTLRKGVRTATTTACELTVAIDDVVVDVSTNSNTKLPLSYCAPCVLAPGDHKITLKAVAVTGSPILNVDDLVLERVVPDCEAVGDDACMSGGEAVKGATDTIRMFTIESKTYPLTVKRDTYVEMLVVGGGGGGGANMGRGGGAGAVVYRVNQLMPAGEYEITVANGGALDGDVGSNGGTTTVTRVDGEMRTDFIVAPGGGGGGNYSKYGRVGACGGGGGNGQAFRGEGCGFGGGGGTGQTDGGGGGGVGSIGLPGGNSTATAGAGFGGAGGKGVSCGITGINEFYGWGGGGSAKSVKDGGASGGAGDSLGYGHGTDGSGAVGAGNSMDGRPNHGGGGGGSMGGTAGVGGSGVVIVRYATPAERADGAPDVTTFTQERIGSRSARLGGRLLSLGGATSASVKILYGTAADQLTSEKSVGVLDAAGDFSVTIRQLSLFTDYWYCFAATANGKTTHSDVRHFKTQGLAAAEWSENAVVTTNGLYEIIAFTNGEGTVTFMQAGAVDILLVGGGGGGQCSDSSWCGGGGGGGGGVVYREGFVPEVGETYSVVVGAGGVGGLWGGAAASAGTDSALIQGSDDVYRAKGGGAGYGRGASGGGVGGNGATATTVWNSNWMQGYEGAGAYTSGTGTEKNGGGGGGAGGPGMPDTTEKGGDGGSGVSCAISGGVKFYGAGGGGGGSSGNKGYAGGAGIGGSGIGGNGGSTSASVGCPGAVNSGSGGGGGGQGAGAGGRGADGIVIIRRVLLDSDDPTPMAAVGEPEVGATWAKMEVSLATAGGEYESTSLYVSFNGGAKELLTDDFRVGTPFTYVKTGLSPETAYDWSFSVANEAKESAAGTGTLTTADETHSGAAPVIEGFAFAVNDDFSIAVAGSVPYAGESGGLVTLTAVITNAEGAAVVTKALENHIGSFAFTVTGFLPGETYGFTLTAANAVQATAVEEVAAFASPATAIGVAVAFASIDFADIHVQTLTLGTGATSAEMTLEYALTADFVQKGERVLPGQTKAPDQVNTRIEGLARNTPYFVRVRMVNDLGNTAYSPVVTFTTLNDAATWNPTVGVVRTADGATVASASLFTLVPGATAAVELFTDGETETAAASWADVKAGDALAWTLPDAATHSLRYVATVTLGESKFTYELTGSAGPAEIGASLYAPGTPAAFAQIDKTVCHLGDRIALPGDTTNTRFDIYDNTTLERDGQMLTCDGCGVNVIRAYDRAFDPVTGVYVDTLVAKAVIYVVPKPEDAPAGVWIGISPNVSWTEPANWTHVSGPKGDGYPNGAGVFAIASFASAGTITIPADGITLGTLVTASYVDGQNAITTINGGALTFKIAEEDGPARLILGKPSTYYAPVNINVDLVFESSTEIDFLGGSCQRIACSGSWTIPAGVTVEMVRADVGYNGNGLTLSGDLIGAGTVRFNSNSYTVLTGTKSFTGVIDVMQSSAGYNNDSGDGAFTMRGLNIGAAKALYVRGTMAAATPKGAFVMAGHGSGSFTGDKVDAYPPNIYLDGGKLQFGAPYAGNYKFLNHFDTFNLTGPMSVMEFKNYERYGTMYTLTNVIAKLNVEKGSTISVGASMSAVVTEMTSPPDFAVDDGDDAQLLPFIVGNWYDQVTGSKDYSMYAYFREKATGRFVQRKFTPANQMTDAERDTFVVYGAYYGFTATVPAPKSEGDEYAIRGFLSSGRVNGGSSVKFAGANTVLKVTEGYVNIVNKLDTGFGADDEASRTSRLDSGDVPLYFYNGGDITMYANIATKGGFIKSSKGALTLTQDASATVSGGVYVNNGTLTFGTAKYAANIGSNPLTVWAGATVKFTTEQPFAANAAVISLKDQAGLGRYAKINLPGGEQMTKCNKLYVDGVAVKRGTWGATGSGAEFIDDNHFTGTGVLKVRRDDNSPGLAIIVR